MTADVTVGGEDVGGGRLVLLYDPAGNDAWQGTFRCVAYARADIDPEMVTDPLLGAVGLDLADGGTDGAHGAEFLAPSGTVTRVASESFGGMDGEPASAEIEVRASWSPLGSIGAARRGVGRSAVRGCRAATRPGWGGRDAQPPRPARLDDSRSRRRPCSRPPPTTRSRRTRRRGASARAARRPPTGRRDARGARRDRRAAFAAGTGPFAIDAERASGYRYSPAGLPDPAAPGGRRDGADRSAAVRRRAQRRRSRPLADADRRRRVDHPRRQPGSGLPRRARSATAHACSTPSSPAACSTIRGSGLAVLVEELLGFRMRKEHSAVDWSRRPLPEPWLPYAALDVELLVELRDVLADQLEEAGKARVGRAGVRGLGR